MSNVITCGVDGLQIGQASSYASYEHFSANAGTANFYIRNTTAGSNAIEINFFVLGKLA